MGSQVHDTTPLAPEETAPHYV